MLKAERKHRARNGRGRGTRIRQIVAAALICLAAVAVSAAVLTRKPPEREQTGQQERGGYLFQADPGEITRVTVRPGRQEPWTMVRGEDGLFQLAGERDWPVDPLISDRITDALAHLEYTDIFSGNDSEYGNRLQEFGLAEPQVSVSWVLENGQEHILHIGDAVEPGEADCCFMVVDGDGRLYGADNGTLQDLRVDRSALHTVPALPVRKALTDRITVRNSAGEPAAAWELTGRVTDRDAADSWKITVPFVYAADEEMMRKLLDNAGNLKLGTYVGEATEERLASSGLSRPDAELEIHMAAGSTGMVTDTGVYDVTDWQEETVTLMIARRQDEMTDYVLYDGAVYTMTHFSLAPFTEADPMAMAARYPVLTPLDSLVSLTVEEEGQKDTHYEISRMEDGETAPECLKNGEPISYESFEAAYQRLLVVTVSGVLPENAEWSGTHTKYTFRTVSGGTHTLWLSGYDEMHDAVTLDGQTIFYLIRNGMTALP